MQHQQSAASQPPPDRLVEAAHYALLRRLASPMRHDMVVHLQPIGMASELMLRRLNSAVPDLAKVHADMTRISGFTRAAVQACLEVVSWIGPQDTVAVALGAGVDECVALLRSSFNFRGFTLVNECGAAPFNVARPTLRNLLPACLFALTDRAVPPAQVVLSATREGAHAVISIALRAGEGSTGLAATVSYRVLEWNEVEALAASEGIPLERSASEVRLTLPIAMP